MTENLIRLIVTNTVTYIEGKLRSEVYQSLKKELGYYPDDAIFKIRNIQKNQKYQWSGLVSTVCYSKTHCHCSIKKDGTHFPTGLLSKTREFFTKWDIPFVLVDAREDVSRTLDLIMCYDDMEERSYQQEMIEKSVKQQRGIIKCSTGGGKTLVMAGIIVSLGVSPFIIYVPSIDLLTQCKNELEKLIKNKDGSFVEIGEIGDGKKNIKDINVMTMQTAVRALGEKYKKFDDDPDGEEDNSILDNYDDVKQLIINAKGFVVDECQHANCATVQIISDYSKNARYRFGASATPWRDLNDDILIDACFGKQICDVNASYLIQNNYLIKPTIYIIPVKHSSGSGFSYPELYKRNIVENSVRNTYIANIANEMRNKGRVVLILCKHIVHGNILSEMIEGSVFLHGIHSSEERKKHLDLMRQRIPSITVASVIFDEGIDVRPLDTLILAGSGRSATRALQRVGRTLRKYEGKENAIVVDFLDYCKYMQRHSNARIKMYKTEPEFKIEFLNMK